jgi:hypothetical protein
MLYTITVILRVAWSLGFVGIYTIGSFVHVLLVSQSCSSSLGWSWKQPEPRPRRSRRKPPATRRPQRDSGPLDLSRSAAWHSLPRRRGAPAAIA